MTQRSPFRGKRAAMKFLRNAMRRFFCKLKEFKRIALRARKTDASFAAMIYVAATILKIG